MDILVEADPAMQTRKYGWNANHPYAVLTNFENLSIYDTTNHLNSVPRETEPEDEVPIADEEEIRRAEIQEVDKDE